VVNPAPGDRSPLSAAPLQYVGEAGTALALRRIGKGPPLIMIPGFPFHSLTYRRLVPLLAQEFTCCCVDLPGTGQSRWDDSTDFSFPAHGRRLKHMADELGLQRYAVLGHDTGGFLARHLALLDPERAGKLIIINTEMPNHRPPWIPLYQKFMALPASSYVIRMLLRSDTYVRSRAGFGGCFYDPRLIDDEFKEVFVRPMIENHRQTLGYGKYLRGFDWAENDAFEQRHAEIRARVLFIWGRDDRTFPEPLGREMAKQLPGRAGFESIPATRLLPHEEKPEEVARLTRSFLRES
jgi:haloalkane dehalogenase